MTRTALPLKRLSQETGGLLPTDTKVKSEQTACAALGKDWPRRQHPTGLSWATSSPQPGRRSCFQVNESCGTGAQGHRGPLAAGSAGFCSPRGTPGAPHSQGGRGTELRRGRAAVLEPRESLHLQMRTRVCEPGLLKKQHESPYCWCLRGGV